MQTVRQAWMVDRTPEDSRVAYKDLFPKGREFPFSDQFVGVEIEVEAPKAIDYFVLAELPWSNAAEGSIRNGKEYISTLGMQAGEVYASLSVLNKHIIEPNTAFSFRCGLHIHVDVSQHTLEDIYKMCLVYSVLEKILFDISGNRGVNRFCVPVQESNNSCSNVIHYGHKREWAKVTREVPGRVKGVADTKYMAMNLRPLEFYNSVEFRHHKGTSNPAEVEAWMRILLDVVVASKALKVEALEENLLAVNTLSFYEALLQSLLPNTHGLIPREGFEKKMYAGVVYAKQCFLTGDE